MLRNCFALAIVLLGTASCGGGGGGVDATAAPAPAATTPAAGAQVTTASVSRLLEVPDSLSDAPLNAERRLTVPPGFGIRVLARVPSARFMAVAPNGDILVSVPSEGKIVLLRERANDVPQVLDYATGLRNPHDMVFHRIGETTWLYVAESHRVTRSAYGYGETSRGSGETVVDDLPDNSTPELQGRYGHQLKNIALSPDNKLYVSIASTCNACDEDTASDPVRGAIYQYSADGKDARLFARGLRNAEGLDFLPGTGTLWAAVNSRDELPVPVDVDVDRDGASDLGRIIPAFIDENPSELFTSVRDGGNYGWPFCNPVPNGAMSGLELQPDYDLNRNGTRFDCATADRSAKGIRAHSAPLGFSFLHNSALPVPYRKGAAVAQHGCWNCTSLRAGYKVSFFPFDDAGNAGAEIELVTGFVTNPDSRSVWGRPVDAVADAKGNLLISDDLAGAIYQLYPRP